MVAARLMYTCPRLNDPGLMVVDGMLMLAQYLQLCPSAPMTWAERIRDASDAHSPRSSSSSPYNFRARPRAVQPLAPF